MTWAKLVADIQVGSTIKDVKWVDKLCRVVRIVEHFPRFQFISVSISAFIRYQTAIKEMIVNDQNECEFWRSFGNINISFGLQLHPSDTHHTEIINIKEPEHVSFDVVRSDLEKSLIPESFVVNSITELDDKKDGNKSIASSAFGDEGDATESEEDEKEEKDGA